MKILTVEWGINDDGEPAINFRKKVELEDVIGIVESEDKTDSVSLKRIYTGKYKRVFGDSLNNEIENNSLQI